jgi:predicted methyltransferase
MKPEVLRKISLLLVAAACWFAAHSPHALGEGGRSAAPDASLEHWRSGLENDEREVYVKRREIVQAVDLEPGMIAADIGAGTGLFTRLFAEQVGPSGRVYAVDISRSGLDKLMQLAEAANLHNIVPVLDSDTDVHLPAGSIDVAYLCDVYHHFDHPREMLRSIYRALKPGGRLVLVDFERIPGKSPQWILEHVPERFAKPAVMRDFEDAGFRFVEEPRFLAINYFVRFERPQADTLTTTR